MSTRTIERAVARRQYDRFSRDWRREKRMAGAWGEPGAKPRFSEWYHIHQGDGGMMGQSTPADVREHLRVTEHRSWSWDPAPDPNSERLRERVEAARRALDGVADASDRGAVTIPIIGEDE